MSLGEHMTELREDAREERNAWDLDPEGDGLADAGRRALGLAEWRRLREEGEEAQLPSQLVVRLRRVSMIDLAEQGEIPATLKPKLNALIQQGRTVRMDLDKLREFIEIVNLVCAACIVGPQDLRVSELPYEDRMAVFNWANQFTGKLQPFRGQHA